MYHPDPSPFGMSGRSLERNFRRDNDRRENTILCSGQADVQAQKVEVDTTIGQAERGR